MKKLNHKSRKKMKRKIMRNEPHWKELTAQLVLYEINMIETGVLNDPIK